MEKEIEYYIGKAKYVFSVIGESKGVQWEVFEHEQQCEKFVYYIADTTTLSNVLQACQDIYKNTAVYYCLLRIMESFKHKECLFYLKDGQCLCYNSPQEGISNFIAGEHTGHGAFSFPTPPIERQNETRNADKSKYKWKSLAIWALQPFRPRMVLLSVMRVVGAAFVSVSTILVFVGGPFLCLACLFGIVMFALCLISPSLVKDLLGLYPPSSLDSVIGLIMCVVFGRVLFDEVLRIFKDE